MGDEVLQLGLIGAGKWGQNYIKTLEKHPDVRLARLASSNPDSRELVAHDCVITTEWRSVAEAKDIDGVIVATPPGCHAEMVCAAMTAGNPVLVEKPLTLDYEEAYMLLELGEQRCAIVHVNHTHLYHPAFRELKRQGREMGGISAIQSLAGAWGPFRTDTPVLWDWGAHDVAMCLDLIGKMPKQVSARFKKIHETQQGRGEIVSVKLIFSGGVQADIEIGNLMEKKRRFFAAHYKNETLIYNGIGTEALIRKAHPCSTNSETKQAVNIPIQDKRPLTQVVEDFAAAIRNGVNDISGLRLGIDVVNVLGALDRTLNEVTS